MYLVRKCVQGLLLGSIFETLSDPAVNGPVPQVPTVRTVTKPGRNEEKCFSHTIHPSHVCFINVQDKIIGKMGGRDM